MIKIKKGLDLPIAGRPEAAIDTAGAVRSVAVLGEDYPGMKPTMLVQEGDRVALGQPLFTDKKTEGVVYTSPGAGTVSAINRGAKRVLQSVVIDLEGDAAEQFSSHEPSAVATLERAAVVEQLRASGLWTALRTRPFSRVPALDSEPHSIFVTAMDSNPLGGDPTLVIAEHPVQFAAGLDVLARLTPGKVFVCHAPEARLPSGSDARVVSESFSGPHPAGLPGTHIHFLDPVSAAKTVWFIGCQDVIAIGYLFLEGRLWCERVVALAGPGVERPRMVRTRLGADLEQLTAGQLKQGEFRVISGSVLAGRTARGAERYLGRYHVQVSVLAEDRERRLFGYLTPGTDRHSVLPIYLSRWIGSKPLQFTTTTNGSPRGMVPVGAYERVMPLDVLPTQLLRALLVGDIDNAIKLGCLELDEDDIALCTYACPGKYEYGPVLRRMLDTIEKEG
ncbi:MAG: Na(+)-translocating NADH-quinone reductase subunit A [Pseudomonadales bacterium]